MQAIGMFLDPTTNETLSEKETIDAHGRDLIGEDDHGFWWGTERAVWVISNGTDWVINGFLGSTPCCAYVRGTREEAVEWSWRYSAATVNEHA